MATNRVSREWVEKLEEVAFVNKAEADDELGELISILKGELDFFPITSVARSEIRNALPVGKRYLADDDELCSDIAYAMGELYTGSGSYWTDLDIIADRMSKHSDLSKGELESGPYFCDDCRVMLTKEEYEQGQGLCESCIDFIN